MQEMLKKIDDFCRLMVQNLIVICIRISESINKFAQNAKRYN